MAFAAGAMGYVVGRDLWPEAWGASRKVTVGGSLLGACVLLLGHLHG